MDALNAKCVPIIGDDSVAGGGKPPQLERFQSLIEHGQQFEIGQVLREKDLKGPVGATRIWVDDVNSDDKLDLLVGDLVTLISPADKVGDDEFKQKVADWQKSLSEVSKLLNSPMADNEKRDEAQKRLQELYNSRSKFMKEDRTGFVWLYLQK